MVVKGVMGAEDARRVPSTRAPPGSSFRRRRPPARGRSGHDRRPARDRRRGRRGHDDPARLRGAPGQRRRARVVSGADAVFVGRMSVYGLGARRRGRRHADAPALAPGAGEDAPAGRRPVHPRPRPELHRRHPAGWAAPTPAPAEGAPSRRTRGGRQARHDATHRHTLPSARRTEQVPPVAGDVQEHGHPTVGLLAGCGHELDPVGCHPLERGIEVVDAEEEADPPRVPTSDDGRLLVAVCLGEQDARRRTGRPYHHPPLRSTVVGRGRESSTS